MSNFPVVTTYTEKTVVLGFEVEGKEVHVELPKTMIKGQAKWAAKRLQEKGANVPEYGTRESKAWASSLRAACGLQA